LAGPGWTPATDGAGSASVGDGALGLLGGDNRDREAERLNPVREIAAEPARDARRKRGDDDLVELASLDRLLHGDEGIAVADDPFDVATRSLAEQWDGQLKRRRGRVGFGVPVGTRHHQRERAGRPAGAGADLVEQPRRRRGAVSHDQDPRRRWGRHPGGDCRIARAGPGGVSRTSASRGGCRANAPRRLTKRFRRTAGE
jgi:hypothetical protein